MGQIILYWWLCRYQVCWDFGFKGQIFLSVFINCPPWHRMADRQSDQLVNTVECEVVWKTFFPLGEQRNSPNYCENWSEVKINVWVWWMWKQAAANNNSDWLKDPFEKSTGWISAYTEFSGFELQTTHPSWKNEACQHVFFDFQTTACFSHIFCMDCAFKMHKISADQGTPICTYGRNLFCNLCFVSLFFFHHSSPRCMKCGPFEIAEQSASLKG